MKLLFIFCFIVIANNIFSQRGKDSIMLLSTKNNVTPSKSRFRLKNTKQAIVGIDTSCVYLFKSYSYDYNDSAFYFIRFFSNNICYCSLDYFNSPKSEEYNKLDYGTFCMYKIKEPNKIVLERYSNQGFPPSFFYDFGYFTDEYIYFDKIKQGKYRIFKKKYGMRFTKIKPNLRTVNINWK